ncbi:hypothetical protein AB6A40_007573 [Gnathostoma spinigerum]|uniref:CDK5 regulatory subunit-associated protein 3 n=1 Tax=Gnathostoma spinigerum TaxID=75299 RepID=A0ABD6ELM0_9BILA
MPRDLLPVCSLLMEGDRDVTVYELKHRKKPTRIERPSVELLEELSETVEAEDGEAEIDFGADEIDFDGADLSLSGIAVVGDSQGEIDDGVARGSEALPLLENDETQQLIKAELKELQAFLSFRRMDEVTESACDIYIAGLENRPAHLSKISVSQIDEQLQKLNEILALLNDPQKIHLFKIRSSPHYIESLVESLEQKKSLEEKYNQMKNLMVERSNDLRKETVAAQNKLKQVAEQTRILQKQIENEISKKYNGRPVNIMGGISAALDMT